MADKAKPAGDSTYQPTDKSELNPAGSARRRMMRQLNAAGAVALTGVIATGWKKPIVDAVLLPAHAQATEETAEDDLPACTWRATLAALSENSTPFGTISLWMGFDGLSAGPVATSVSTSSFAITRSGTLEPSAAHSWGMLFSRTGGGSIVIAMSADVTCCTLQPTNEGSVNLGTWTGGNSPSFLVTTVSGGACSVVPT